MADNRTAKPPRKRRGGQHPTPPPPTPSTNGHAGTPYDASLRWLTADRVVRSPIDWFVPDLIPRNRCTAVVGESGVGKSTLYAKVIAVHTLGCAHSAFGPAAAGYAPGRAMLYSPEGADAEETIGRLRAAEADLGRVLLGDLGPAGTRLPSPRLPQDLELLAGRWIEARVSLVVLDPILSYCSPDLSPHDGQAVRGLLEALEEVATVRGITLLYTCHLRKSRMGPPLDWIAGAAAWHQVPRHIVAMGRDPKDAAARVILSAKSTVSEHGTSRSYSIRNVEGAGLLEMGAPSTVTAEDLGRATMEDYERDALREAKEYLKDALVEEVRRSRDLIAAGKAMGISDRTMRRAKVQLGVTHHHMGKAPERHVVWRKPEAWLE